MPIPVASLLQALVTGNVPGVSAGMSVLGHYATSKANRMVLSTLGPAFVRQGLSGAKALNLMKAVGIGVRKTDFYKMWNTAKSFVKTSDYLHKVGMGTALDTSMARATDVLYPNQYTVKVNVDYFNKRTGEFTTRWITMGVSPGESKESIQDRLWASLTVWYMPGEDPDETVIFDFVVDDYLESRAMGFEGVSPWEC